jgi:hypothetical protein
VGWADFSVVAQPNSLAGLALNTSCANLVQIVLLIAKLNGHQAGTINTTALTCLQKMITAQYLLWAKPAKSAGDQ